MSVGIVFGTAGQLLMKYFAVTTPLKFGWDLPLQLVTNIPLMLVFGWYFVGAIMWLFILQKLPLSLAYPTLALNYLTVALGSVLLFNESWNLGKSLAYLLIITGIVLLYKYQS